MIRGLIHASVACVMTVCLTMSAEMKSAEIETDPQHVGPGSITAGREHSVMAMPDGRVLAWGAGGRGQIGDGGLRNRLLPASVLQLEGIVALAAGTVHTVAMTKNGDLYAWGGNAFGQLGDGTRKRRTVPVRVPGITNVTMVAAGRAHTLAVTSNGHVYGWGSNAYGQLGTGRRVDAERPVRISALSSVVAVAAGDGHSLAVTRDGRLFAWGDNRLSQLGDGTARDRLRPVAVVLTNVIAVAAGGEHSLALVQGGAVYSWGRAASGELGTGSRQVAAAPTLVPGLQAKQIAAGQHFSGAIRSDGAVVAWGANEAGQLGDRTTTRRLRPVRVEGLNSAASLTLGGAHGVAVTTSGALHTWGAGQAGQLGNGATLNQPAPAQVVSDIPNWGRLPDDESEPPETGTIDSVPPSVIAVANPTPAGHWNTTPVTVSFVCSDNVGIASCPVPVTVTQDGEGQLISRTAIDLAGNTATAGVTINLDTTRPTVELLASVSPETSSDTLSIAAHVNDLVSGIAGASCNDNVAAIDDGIVRCTVTLRKGRNVVIVRVSDVAGNVASTSALVSQVDAGEASSLSATPASVALIIGESRGFSVTADNGRRIESPEWQSNDPAIVAVEGGKAIGVGIGSTTLIATAGGLSATVDVSVHPGPYLPAGVTRWSLPLSASATPEAHTVMSDGSHGVNLFSIEYAGESRTAALVRALGVDGSERWTATLPVDATDSVLDIALAPNGGLLAVVSRDYGSGAYSLVRAGWSEDSPTWRYDPPEGVAVHQVVQAPNGFIYLRQAWQEYTAPTPTAGQRVVDHSELIGVNGMTGAVVFRQAEGNYVTSMPSSAGRVDETHSGSGGRLALTSNGDVYYVMRTGTYSYVDRVFNTRFDLLRLDQSGASTAERLFDMTAADIYPMIAPVIAPLADADGGVFLEWVHVSHAGGRLDYTGMYRSPTQSGDFALTGLLDPQVTSLDGTMIGRQHSSTGAQTVAIDMRSGAVRWATAPIDGEATVALADQGAVFVDAAGSYRIVDGDGNLKSLTSHGVPHGPYAYGRFHGRDVDGTLRALPSGPLDDATLRSSVNRPAGISTAPTATYGVHAKAFNVWFQLQPVFKHLGLALVPHNQASWLDSSNRWSTYFKQSPGLYGDLWIVTTGGGPTGLLVAATLEQFFNKEDGDFDTPADPGYWLPLRAELEDATIAGILTNSLLFRDNVLPYELTPLQLSPGYNSNSFARSLFDLQGLTAPAFFTSFRFPGSSKPVPAIYFGPGPINP
jgi:alpha-tubulin suppressor-like RCC1 family protein